MTENLDLSHVGWRKSTRSGANGQCVEVAVIDGLVAIRDSKDPGGSQLRISRSSASYLLAATKDNAANPGRR